MRQIYYYNLVFYAIVFTFLWNSYFPLSFSVKTIALPEKIRSQQSILRQAENKADEGIDLASQLSLIWQQSPAVIQEVFGTPTYNELPQKISYYFADSQRWLVFLFNQQNLLQEIIFFDPHLTKNISISEIEMRFTQLGFGTVKCTGFFPYIFFDASRWEIVVYPLKEEHLTAWSLEKTAIGEFQGVYYSLIKK